MFCRRHPLIRQASGLQSHTLLLRITALGYTEAVLVPERSVHEKCMSILNLDRPKLDTGGSLVSPPVAHVLIALERRAQL